jgi:hypothetical protein
MAKGDDDLRARRVAPQEIDDLRPERRGGIARQSRNSFRVEEDHPRPANALGRPARRREVHHEEIPLVVEGVLAQREIRQSFSAELREQGKMLLAPFERLLHRDHAVPEHACLAHGFRVSRLRSRVSGQPIESPESLKISLAMISR